MAKRILIPTNLYLDGDTHTYHVDITANLLKFKIVVQGQTNTTTLDSENPENDVTTNTPFTNTVCQYQVSLDTLKQATNLRSNTLLGVVIPVSFNGIDVLPKHLIDYSKLTKELRLGNCNSLHIANPFCTPYVFIFIKDIDGTFEDHDIMVYGTENMTLDNINSEQIFEMQQVFSHVSLLDDITVTENTSYNNADYYKFNVSSETYVDEVFLEQVVGITDKTRVKLTSGQGSFRVLKSSLESGDTLRVKVGFAAYPGLVNVTKTV